MSDSAPYSEDVLEAPRVKDASVPPPDRMKHIYRALTIIAPLSIVIAIAVNWVTVPDARQVLPSPAGVGSPGVPGVAEITLEKPAIRFVPERIIGYEAISHQTVPGWGKRAAEAVYKTLSMNVEAQISIVTYTRTEGYGSQGEAQARLNEFMKPYTRELTKKKIGNGTVIATIAQSQDRGTRIAGWVHGGYVTIVKTSFSDWIPADEKGFKFRDFQNDQVIDGVIVFQQTGREGINK